MFNFQKVHASATYYIDFSKVLNESEAGSKAQKFLKDKFNSESDRFDKLEKMIWGIYPLMVTTLFGIIATVWMR